MMAVGKKGKGMTLNKMASCDGMVHDGIGIGVPVRVFVEVLARTHILLCEMVINIIWMAFIVDYVVSILLAEDKKTLFQRQSADAGVHRIARLQAVETAASGGSAQRAQSYRWHGGAWAHHTVHMLQRDTADVYRRPCRMDVERGVNGASITDFGEAIWWSFVTVTTVGYGDLSPVTWQGRCIAIGLMITGVALIGIVTATLASWIVDRVRDETDKRADEANRKRNSCANNVRELTDTVNQLRDDIAQLRRL